MWLGSDQGELNRNLRKIEKSETLSQSYEDALATWVENTGKEPDSDELLGITGVVLFYSTWRVKLWWVLFLGLISLWCYLGLKSCIGF